MYQAFVDESGDEGTSEKSSPWLTLGGIILPDNEVSGAKDYLHEGIAGVWAGGTPPSHVHFQGVRSHGQRKAVLHMATGLNFTACVVPAKKSAFNVLSAMGCPRLYNYAFRHLLERISWYGFDRGQQVIVTVASRNEDTWKQLKEYLRVLEKQPGQIKWAYIAKIRNAPASTNVILQATDWTVSGFTLGLNPDSFGNVEMGYSEILWGKFWVRKGNLWAYGIKPLPGDLDRTQEKLFRKIAAWKDDPTTIIR